MNNGIVAKKVKAIMAMELPKVKQKPKLVRIPVDEMINILERFDKKIDIALFISDKTQ